MKVDETYQNINLIDTARESGAARGNENEPARATRTEQPEKGETEVALSSTSREVMKAREAMETSEPARAEKVAELRQKVADGTYEQDARDVADKMLEAAISELL